jgi:hypothetical protein
MEDWPSSAEQAPSHLAAASLLLQDPMQPVPAELLPCFQLAAQLRGCLSVSAAGPRDLGWAGALTAPWPSNQDVNSIPCDNSSEDSWSCHYTAPTGAPPTFPQQQPGAPAAFIGHKRAASCISSTCSSNTSSEEVCQLTLGLPPPAFAPRAATPVKRAAVATHAHDSSMLAWTSRGQQYQNQQEVADEEEDMRRLRVEQWLPMLHQACPPAGEDMAMGQA